MSLSALGTCWGDDFPCEGGKVAGPTVRLIALAVADIVNDTYNNEFFGSLPRLAAKCGVHRNTVREAMLHLTSFGVVTVIELRPGQPTRYQWVWQPRADHAGSVREPRANEPKTPRERRANTQGTQVDPKPPVNGRAAAAACQASFDGVDSHERTAGQRGKQVQVELWKWITERTGHKPRALSPVGFTRVAAGLVEHGATEAEVLVAAKALYERGAPIKAATIEAEMDGRRPAQRQSTREQLRALEFDADGNLIG